MLRGCSQLCFQINELTGLFFLAAVLVASPIAAAYMLVAAIIAPGGRMLLGERGPVLATGLPGLNPCLIALSLPAFFQTGWTNVGMWVVLVVCVAIAVVLVRVCRGRPAVSDPGAAVPDHVLGPLCAGAASRRPPADRYSGRPVPRRSIPLAAVLLGLGQAMFSPTIAVGASVHLRRAAQQLAARRGRLLGAVIGTVVSYYYRDVDPASIDLGLYGFNGVLAAVSVFVFCGGKLRLAILGALLATILMPAIADFGVQTLSAPFVLTTWLMLALGWIEDRLVQRSVAPPRQLRRQARIDVARHASPYGD